MSFWLLLAAILLWPVDIALRRFGIALPATEKKPTSKTVPPDKQTAGLPEKSTFERLLEAKENKKR